MICIGATLFFLSHENPDARSAMSTFLGGMELLKLSKSFSLRSFGFRVGKRSYAFRIPGRRTTSTLITLNLPEALNELVTTYAGLMNVSRNETYSKCLLQGLLVYLYAQTKILPTSPK